MSRRPKHDCECGVDLPGQCPGPAHCPYSEQNSIDPDDDEIDLPDDDLDMGNDVCP